MYAERLRNLDLPTLAFRRKRIDLIELYKHFHLYDKLTLATYFKQNLRLSRKHNFHISIPPERDGIYGPYSLLICEFPAISQSDSIMCGRFIPVFPADFSKL